MVPRIFILALAIHIVTFPLLSQTGEVEGRVFGISGDPVQGAHVYALSAESINPARHLEVLTDAKGEFLLENVHEGQNEIHAYAPELGYPDNMFAVFQTAPVPVVTVNAGAVIRGVEVHLGPRPGTLAGEVVDRQTRKPLPTASITLSWADRPDFYARSSVGQDGRFTFLVPVRPLLVVVTCDGYRTWKSTALTVSSGGTFPLAVEMRK